MTDTRKTITIGKKTVRLPAIWSKEKGRPNFFWVLAPIAVPAFKLMAKYRFTDTSKLPLDGACIVAPNHMSEIDPLIVATAMWQLGRLPRFMAKASIFRIPVVGWIMRATGQIPVERDKRKLVENEKKGVRGSRNPLEAARKIMERKSCVIVYPEGTLTRDPDLWPMRGKTGAVSLALESGLPLIPVAHWGVQNLMPRYGKKINLFPRKTIKLSFGEPLDLSEFKGKPVTHEILTQATEKLMREISRMLAELRGENAPTKLWNPKDHNQAEVGRFA